MWILTLLIGKGWTSLFGDSLISFRVLNWIMLILSILLPFIILIPSNSQREYLKYVSITIILMTILNDNVFGGDVCTVLFLALSASLIIKFYQSSKLYHLILYSLSSTFLILARFPNILIVGAFIVVFSIIEYYKNYPILQKRKVIINSLKKLSIYFAVSISCYGLIIMLVYGSFSEFASKLGFSIMNIEESHTIITMLKMYVKDFVKLFQYVSVCFLIFLIVNVRLNFNLIIKMILTILAYVCLILFLKVEIGIENYNWNISLFYSAIVISVLVYYSFLYIQKKEYIKLVFISFILIYAIIPVLGSTTGLLKLSPFLLSFLPVILASNKSGVIKDSNLSYLFGVVLLFVIYTKMMIVYEDSKITNLRYELKTERINHIKTTNVNVEFIEDVLKEFEEINNDNKSVLFFGKVSHIFYYLTRTKPLYQNSFWMSPYNISEINIAEHIIFSKRPFVIFLPSYPENSIQYFNNRNTYTPFETMLIKNGYEAITKNSFIIYKP